MATLAVLVAVATAQGGDLLTFLRMIVTEGLAAEANPLVAHGVGTLGVEAMIAAKIGLIFLIVAIFAVLSRTHRRTAGFVATIAVLAGLLGTFTNIMAMA